MSRIRRGQGRRVDRIESSSDSQASSNDAYVQVSQNRRLKKITSENKELIQRLKKQSETLSKKINKKKNSLSKSTEVRGSPKQLEAVKKQLQNGYRQIQMYQITLQGLRAKEVSIESVQRMKQLQFIAKQEDKIIENYQKDLRHLAEVKEKQQKQLKVYENDDIRRQVRELQRTVHEIKERMKEKKKRKQKMQELDKKQHFYLLQLELTMRKLNDDYYPGKQEKPKEEDDFELSEKEWKKIKADWGELKIAHEENTKKIGVLKTQTRKQLKSFEENQLKIKERVRKMLNLKTKCTQLKKLSKIRQRSEDRGGKEKGLLQSFEESVNFGKKNQAKKQQQRPSIKKKEKKQEKKQPEREAKKWAVPQAYSLEKGKIVPSSVFFSDKNFVKNSIRTKITKVHIWSDKQKTPCLLQFFYQNQQGEKIDGNQPFESIPPSLSLEIFEMKETDYIFKINGSFLEGQLAGLTLVSKLGKTINKQNQIAQSEGDKFSFEPRPNQIPSLMFGAYVKKGKDQIKICHLGVEFMKDW